MTDETIMETAPPSGGVPRSTPRDIALQGLSDADAHRVILAGTDIGIHSPQDATWILLRKIRDGIAAAQASADAATRIEDATKDVANTIFEQTRRAGEDLKSLVSSGIRETTLEIGKRIGGAIETVTQRSADHIREAAGEVDQVARAKMAGMMQEYKANLAQAAMEEAKKRGAFMGAVRWGVVAMVIFGSILFGGFIIYAGLDMTRHILPWTDHLINIKGRADCGFIQSLNGRVCGVN